MLDYMDKMDKSNQMEGKTGAEKDVLLKQRTAELKKDKDARKAEQAATDLQMVQQFRQDWDAVQAQASSSSMNMLKFAKNWCAQHACTLAVLKRGGVVFP